MKKTAIFILILALAASGFYFRSVQYDEKLFVQSEIIDAVHAHGINAVFREADNYKYQQDYHKALTAFEKLLKQNLKPADKIYALNQAAYINLRMNDDSSASRYIQLLSAEKMPVTGSVDEADYNYNVGVWAYRTFKPKMSEQYLRRALELYKKNYGNQHVKTAMCMAALGIYYYEYCMAFDSAFYYAPLAYSVFQNNPALKNWSPESLLGMAFVSNFKRRYDEMVGLPEQAIIILNQLPVKDSVLMARCWSFKARGLHMRGRKMSRPEEKKLIHSEIENCYQNARSICPKTSIRTQEYLRDQTRYYANTDTVSDPDRTIHFWKYLGILRNNISTAKVDRLGFPDRLLGEFFTKNNDTDSAIYYCSRFFNRYQKDSLKQIPILVQSCSMLTYLFEVPKKYKNNAGFLDSSLYYQKYILLVSAGEKSTNLFYKEIINSKSYIKSNGFPFIYLGTIAVTLLKKYNVTGDVRVLDTCEQIIKITDTLVFKSLSSHDDDAFDYFQGAIEYVYGTALTVSGIQYQLKKDKKYLDEIFKYGERFRSFLLYRDADSKNNGVLLPSENLRDSLKLLEAQINALKLSVENGKTDNIALSEKQSKREQLYEQLKKENPEYYQLKVSQPISTVKEVQAGLKPTDLLVQYTFSGNVLNALFISKKDIFFRKTDWDTSWNNNIKKFYGFMDGSDMNVSAQQYSTLGFNIYKKLFPVLPAVFNDCRTLIISPDGILNVLPFEALTQSGAFPEANFKNLQYLVHCFDVTYTPSWKMYRTNKNNILPDNPSVLAYTYAFEHNELPAAEKEFSILKSIFSDKAKLIIGDKCSKKLFLADTSSGFDILHLSLHAESDADSKYNNKIYFAPHHTDTVYGFNLLQRKFAHKLIVLSACNTAFGKIIKGEGVFTLSRNFLRAGVPCVVASLWRIPDNSTEKITTAFYQSIKAKSSPTQALQNAKRLYLSNKSTNSATAHPHYWAGLVCLD